MAHDLPDLTTLYASIDLATTTRIYLSHQFRRPFESTIPPELTLLWTEMALFIRTCYSLKHALVLCLNPAKIPQNLDGYNSLLETYAKNVGEYLQYFGVEDGDRLWAFRWGITREMGVWWAGRLRVGGVEEGRCRELIEELRELRECMDAVVSVIR